MNRELFLVAIIVTSILGFAGCNGDNGTTSTNQLSSQLQEDDFASESSNPTDSDSVNTEDSERGTGICYANNFDGQRFRVVSYANNIIEASIAPINCRLINDRLKGEVRRPGVTGIREFVGNANWINGTRIKIYAGTLPKLCRPKKGELLTMVWKARRRG